MQQVATPKEVGYLPLTLTARKRMVLTMTERQYDILVGSILGDAYITPKGKIQFEQSIKQSEYLQWKFNELKSLAYGEPQKVVHIDRRNGATYQGYRFWLRQYFRPWRDTFYKDDHKIIPKSLMLNPVSLAVWYMDDGSFSDKTCSFSAESFSENSLQDVQTMLLRRFGIETKIRSNGKLLIRAKSQRQFFDLIRPHMHKSMLYKLP